MKTLIEAELGLSDITVKKLNGYENINYLVSSKSDKIVFKSYEPSKEIFDLVITETDALLSLQTNPNNLTPSPLAFLDGSFVKTLKIEGQDLICRALTFLEGDFMVDVAHTKEMIHSFGTELAKLDVELQLFNSYITKSRVWEWDLQYFLLNEKYLSDVQNVQDRKVIHYFLQQFKQEVIPLIPELRKQVIHNDANDWNVLCNDKEITGLIDFGDLAHSMLISELAIAISYVCFEKEKPLDWAEMMVNAYHSVIPLEEKELKVLYYLIIARLCTSILNSSHSRKMNPENKYASVSEVSALKSLHQWLRINPIGAENRFRNATGLKPVFTPNVSALISDRHQFMSPLVSLSYKEPIHMMRSAFQYMYDAAGNTYLDAYNNIPHVGHSHPSVVEAGQKQMAILNTNTRYVYPQLAEYASKLLSKFPSVLTKVYFVNSGSAASDLAIRIAKVHTGHENIMVMEHGYHGHTQASTDISDYKFNHPKGQGKKAHILKATIPDNYRGEYARKEKAGELYANDTINQLNASSDKVAAFITEPIVGCGGQVPLAHGYLSKIYPAIREQGGVCISDEVQTGFGRLGEVYWGFEQHNVIPDIVVIGKPMGNSHPMGAVICTEEIASSFGEGVEFFSSFGGNPVSCAIGSAVLDVIDEEDLQENAKNVGLYYQSLFNDLKKKYPCIGDVRGAGLFIGVEIVHEKSRKPNTELAHKIKNELRNRFILISTDGPFDNVIKTKPPMCFSKENAKEVVEMIGDVLAENN